MVAVVQDGKRDPPDDPVPLHQPRSTPSLSGLLHYAGAGVLLLGALCYWYLKSPSVNPMADPMAAEAMALVQTHRAQRAPTLRQAITDRVQAMAARGQGVRLGEWRVEHQQGDIFLVRIWVREQGTRQWFEQEYIWRVDVAKRLVEPLTMPATDLMPVEVEGVPPTRSPDRSS